MDLKSQDLLTGETLILSKGANALIKPNEVGLSRFAFDHLLPLVGMKGKEAIGGKLHVTNFRLVFAAHAINRLTGKFSIFLPTIQDVRDTSGLIAQKIEVNTRTQKFEFVVWGIPALLEAIQKAKTGLTAEDIQTLRHTAVVEYQKCGEGMQVFNELEKVNTVLSVLALRKPHFAQIAGTAKSPIEAATALNLAELCDE